jgi:hypothetical protein
MKFCMEVDQNFPSNSLCNIFFLYVNSYEPDSGSELDVLMEIIHKNGLNYININL